MWITGGGARFHYDHECTSLNQGQDEARERGDTVHSKTLVRLRNVVERTECLTCAARPENLEPAFVETPVETNWEALFRRAVLKKLPQLEHWKIHVQEELRISGRTYRPDFTLRYCSQQIAIEIDGADKGPGGPDHTAWTRRQNALTAKGWQVLRFTNEDVVREPERCQIELTQAITRAEERERQAAAVRSAAGSASSASKSKNAATKRAPSKRQAAVKPTPPRVAEGPASDHPNVTKQPVWTATPMVEASPRPAVPASTAGKGSKAVVAWTLFGAFAAALLGLVIWASQRDRAAGETQPVDDGRGIGYVVCPPSHPIKGNIGQSGSMIYHEPGSTLYDETKPETCFVSGGAASDAGFRAPR